LEVPVDKQAGQRKLLGAPVPFASDCLFCHGPLRSGRCGHGLADGPDGYSGQKVAVTRHHDSIYDSVLVQIHGLAGCVPQWARRKPRLSAGSRAEYSGLAGLRPHCHHPLHVTALLCVYLHYGFRLASLHQLGVGGDGRDSGRWQSQNPAQDHTAPGDARHAVCRDPDLLQGHRHLRRHQLLRNQGQFRDVVQSAVHEQQIPEYPDSIRHGHRDDRHRFPVGIY